MASTPLAFLPPDFPEAFRQDLAALYGAPQRAYHNLDHLEWLWARHREYADLIPAGSGVTDLAVGLTIAYHDAVYDPRAAAEQNERLSEELFRKHRSGFPASLAARLLPQAADCISRTILATAHHPISKHRHLIAPDCEGLTEWFCDLDLTGLAADPETFRRNGVHVRQEYGHVSDAGFLKGRRAFYASLLEAPALFVTPALNKRLEDPARRNIAWAIWALDRGHVA